MMRTTYFQKCRTYLFIYNVIIWLPKNIYSSLVPASATVGYGFTA